MKKTQVFLMVLMGTMLAAPVVAHEGERGERIENRFDERGDRINDRLDARAERVEERYDAAAERAREAGKDKLADRLEKIDSVYCQLKPTTKQFLRSMESVIRVLPVLRLC